MEFYGHVAAFLMILGFRLFWLGGLETWLPETLKKSFCGSASIAWESS